MLQDFLVALGTGDAETASRLADTVFVEAQRCDDDGLLALALLSRGEAALALHETTRGVKLLDEAMVVVMSGDVPPIPAGIVYCGVIDSCMQISDLGHAAEWTERSIGGVPRSPTWCPTEVNASSTARRSSRPVATGRRGRRTPNVRVGTCPSLRIPRSAWRCTSRVSCTGSAAMSARRSSRTGPRAEQGREPAPGMALLRLGQGRAPAR